LKFRLFDVTSGQAQGKEGGAVSTGTEAGVAQAAWEVLHRVGGLDAVGCRVVHGGESLRRPTRSTPQVRQAIRSLAHLAPLHNPVAADILDALDALLPGTPAVAVFDTAFHSTLPEVAWRYAIPEAYTSQGMRRYGFHGISHQYVSRRLGQLEEGGKHIICHLGNGSSLCAARDGVSVDTSMGMTPLEGLVMGTRSGDLGADIVLEIARSVGVEEAGRILNHESGLKALCGNSGMREVLARKDDKAQLALDLFIYRLRKAIGSYAAVLEGLTALAFTGGIGEHAAEVRARACLPLGWLGVELDREANDRAQGEARISTDRSRVAVWVLPTDEEREIALQAAGVASAQGRSESGT
jgi:acetate kinase